MLAILSLEESREELLSRVFDCFTDSAEQRFGSAECSRNWWNTTSPAASGCFGNWWNTASAAAPGSIGYWRDTASAAAAR